MAAILIVPVFLLINFYLLFYLLKWLRSIHPQFERRNVSIGCIVVYVFLSTTVLASFLFTRPLFLHRILKPVSNLFLGYFLYGILFVLFFDLLFRFLKCIPSVRKQLISCRRFFPLFGTFVLFLVLFTGTYGFFHEKKLYTKTYDVSVEKSVPARDSLKVALVSDLHLGYNIGKPHVKALVNRLNELDADLVCFAGDTFDNEFEAVSDPKLFANLLSQIESTYGVYACFGNHDLDQPLLFGSSSEGSPKEQDEQMLSFFKDANIRLLNDEAVLIDDSFYLVGRKDLGRSEKHEDGRLSPEELLAPLDKTKPILVLDHEPDELRSLAGAGADLDLSGHTHAGQFFPGNLLIDLFWENSYGLMEVGNMTSVVTSGVGVWGPNMRVGTNSEVVLLNLHFQGQ